MIIDSHAYCFEPADSPRGYADSREHLLTVQQAQAGHHQPAFRLRDRVAGPSDVLDPTGGDLADLPDVNFRINRAAGPRPMGLPGRDLHKHFYPPNLRNLEFTPESLIGEMDYAGIDKVLLHTNAMLGRSNRYQSECVQRCPDRILSMALLDERQIHTDVNSVIAGVTAAINDLGLHAIKFNPAGYTVSDQPWDSGTIRPVLGRRLDAWRARLLHFVYRPGPHQRGAPRPRRPAELPRRATHSHTPHGSSPPPAVQHHPRLPLARLPRRRPHYPADGIWAPFENPNLSLKVCFPVRIGDIFDYPYREVWPTLAAMVERIGPGQLMYGTDMPFQNRFCTYRQSRHWLERHFAPAAGLCSDDLAPDNGRGPRRGCLA